ncbi:MAG TPA: DUF4936 family protein [Mariprofundaceae bacterium]|nr:DUF4936 family protein [Mariprofundaceae bacterium]
MPEASAFIWYHAEASLQSQLLGWLQQVESRFGVRGQLFVRHAPEKTTFMELYDSVESATLVQIEALAARQPWIDRMQSPRHAECFNKVERND